MVQPKFELTLNPAALTDGDPATFAGAQWAVVGSDQAHDAAAVYVGDAQSGVLDASGAASVMLQETPVGGVLTFVLAGLRWDFVMPARAAVLSALVTEHDPATATGRVLDAVTESEFHGEVSARQAGDAALGARIDALPEGVPRSVLDAEAQTRADADTRLLGRINTNADEVSTLTQAASSLRMSLASLEGRYDILEPDPATVDGVERYLAAVLRGGDVVTYWDAARQVPIAGRVDDVLVKSGENDTDYRFRGIVALLDDVIGGPAWRSVAEIPDDSILAAKLRSDSPDQQAAFRARIGAGSAETQAMLARNLQQAQIDVGRARDEALRALNVALGAVRLTRRLRPISRWVRRGATAATIYLHWRPSVDVAQGAAIAVSVGGTANNIAAPEALAADEDEGTVLTVPITAANAGTIDRSADAVRGYVRVQVTFNRQVYTCWIEAVDPAAPVPRSRIVQAAVDVSGGGANLGVASVVLPADYATYRDLNLALYESQDAALADHDIRTILLAAQRGQVEITVAGNPGVAASAGITWNPGTRTITALTQRNAPVRIVYAELHD